MQTFITDHDFSVSARHLDSKRLQKQSVECLQIMNVLLRKQGVLPVQTNASGRPRKGFWNHPAVRMWEGHERHFFQYWKNIILECASRGIKNDTISVRYDHLLFCATHHMVGLHAQNFPSWLTDAFIRAHQSNLIRKNPVHYGPLFHGVPDNLPYIWPR